MSTVTSSTTTEVYEPTNGTGVTYNPNSTLSKDEFLKLFLVELQNQDPTEPMDTEKIIAQTADLTTVESMENISKSIDGLVSSYQSTSNMSAISAVGKIGDTGYDSFNMSDGGVPVSFDMYFQADYTQAEVFVFDSTGNMVKKIPVEDGKKGLVNINWDGTDEFGNAVQAGAYKVEAAYRDAVNFEGLFAKMGAYPIDSVIISGEEAEAKLGNEYFKFSEIREISDPYKPSY